MSRVKGRETTAVQGEPSVTEPAKKRQAKPGPGTRAKTPSKTRNRSGTRAATTKTPVRQKQPTVNRALRDLRVVELKAQGLPMGEVARIDGRSERTVHGILESHASFGISNSADLLRVDPVTIMQRMLDRVETVYGAAFETALESREGSARVGALRLMLDAQLRQMEMLQHLNLLPRNLGTFRHVIDLRSIGERMVQALEAVEADKMTLGEAKDVFRELAGYGKPQIEAVDGVATEEAAA